jgi:hypothetical protein
LGLTAEQQLWHQDNHLISEGACLPQAGISDFGLGLTAEQQLCHQDNLLISDVGFRISDWALLLNNSYTIKTII